MPTKNSPTLGIHLLDTITKGMYSQPMHCIREYVQNAYDGIRTARREGVIAEDDGKIEISIDPDAKRVRIRDNGTGMDPESAAVALIDLGNSNKATSSDVAKSNAGFRGIGRMAGISYCNNLSFRTSSKGFSKECVVTFNAKAINTLTRRGQKPESIVDTIEKNTDIVETPAPPNEHYTEVTLDGVNKRDFLDAGCLNKYLGQVAPVPYDPQTWPFEEDIRKIATQAGMIESLDAVIIEILGEDGGVKFDVRRTFQNIFSTADSRGRRERKVVVQRVRALPDKNQNMLGWWGWLAVHEYAKQLSDVHFAGIRLRMHNIEIGDEGIFRSLFKSSNLATWCFGEIHLTDASLTPNAQRDNIEDSHSWEIIRKQLEDVAADIESLIRSSSNQLNKSVDKFVTSANRVLRDADKRLTNGLVSVEEKELWIGKIGDLEEKIARESERETRSETDRTSLVRLSRKLAAKKEDVANVSRTQTDRSQARWNKQARKAIAIIFRVLRQLLDEQQFLLIQERINEALKAGSDK